MFSDEVMDEIKIKARELYEKTKPWGFTELHLRNYKSSETIDLLLAHYNIVVDERVMKLDSFCGMLIVDELGSNILINQNHISTRKLFTIAHELGHYVLHRGIQDHFLDNGLNENIYSYEGVLLERQANVFASELLIPHEVLEKMLHWKYSFHKIALTLGVSKEALKWRLHNYLMDKFKVFYRFSLMIIEDFKIKSLEKRVTASFIFDLQVNRYVLFEIYEALCGRESYIENYRLPPKEEVIF